MAKIMNFHCWPGVPALVRELRSHRLHVLGQKKKNTEKVAFIPLFEQDTELITNLLQKYTWMKSKVLFPDYLTVREIFQK